MNILDIRKQMKSYDVYIKRKNYIMNIYQENNKSKNRYHIYLEEAKKMRI